jgi:thiol-disulfide isomerase/thioredoxin
MRRFLALALALAALAGCGRGAEQEGDGVSLPADPLELPQYDLARYRALLAELEGTPVLVNFWGSWCPPCENEAPFLAKVSEEFEGEVQFLGVDILDSREPARDFIQRHDWQYPSIFDPTAAIRDGLGYIGQPITLIYDRDGELAWEWVGEVSEKQLREEIGAVL